MLNEHRSDSQPYRGSSIRRNSKLHLPLIVPLSERMHLPLKRTHLLREFRSNHSGLVAYLDGDKLLP